MKKLKIKIANEDCNYVFNKNVLVNSRVFHLHKRNKRSSFFLDMLHSTETVPSKNIGCGLLLKNINSFHLQ